MKTLGLMAIGDDGTGIGSCFGAPNNFSKDQEQEFNKLQKKAERIIKENFGPNQERNSIDMPRVNEKHDEDVLIIDPSYDKTNPRCAKITIIICREDWKKKGGFEKSLKNDAINHWLRCWDKNQLTYFITTSWEANSFKTLKNYIESYCDNNNHNVLVLMWDKTNGLIPKYLNK
jgi:hypothetical protein